MKISKPRLTVDYAHNDSEVLGYLNHFDISGGDLVASGALTPWREDDRASEVMFKMQQGVPYEASIFFGGDGIRLEAVDEGSTIQVNGRAFSGPGVIIREWPLRGVAICPYGADANTESRAMKQDETVSVKMVKANKEIEMEQEQKAVDTEALAEVTPTVEPAAVEVEVESEDKPEDEKAEIMAEIEVLKKQRDDLKAEIEAMQAERDGAKPADVASDDPAPVVVADEMAAMRTALELANTRLAAFESGALPLSAKAAIEKETENAWKKAQKRSR
jgi:hypothetical protein